MTCLAKKTGRPLSVYLSKAEAQEAARHVKKTYGHSLTAYRCDSCGQWHLSPKERQTPSQPCPHCRGSDGKAKAAYRTEMDARQRAKILAKEQGVNLTVYACEFGQGWHLTKLRD